MLITRYDGQRSQSITRDWSPKLSTSPRQQYVSYLCTDELVRAIARVDLKLLTRPEPGGAERIKALKLIRADLLAELRRRQLEFPETWD